MRIAQKKQAEEFVELLGQAHEEIRNAIEKKNISAAMSLLADCQDGAIALGDLIENAEGERAATIPLLESYCELVYGIHQSLGAEMEGAAPVRADKTYKTLRQGHIRIVNSLTHDIKVRREVVFLPYKASMWDSLESVWKAADEDPECDAYVIPIPYYDKNPDGSFREQHYEGGQYPEYVPVVWYEDYDFEKRRPDMIFIHNPYDDCNIVTSVPPFFYSKNLKNFTDKLVYIPYFILGEIDPQNRQELESIEKFCLVPGVAYADEVIVQSEDMRQAYINVLTEFMSGQGRSRAYWEKKILGLGSPKVDKVLSTRKEDLEIPEEWMEVIRRPDGSWKKIIFYNTTVTALLQYNEQYLEKMRDVFRVFYENRDEVALLWRPHPLFGATIESMRPELGETYRGIVESYRRDGWGIYDDTADMDRAVCLSDGYYGDMSSVLQLYRNLNKGTLIQDPQILSVLNSQQYFPDIACTIYWKENLYFSSGNYNAFYKIDMRTGILKYVGKFERENLLSKHLFGMSKLFQDRILLSSVNAEYIHIYDMAKQEDIVLNPNDKKRRGRMYADIIALNSKVYLIPATADDIIEVDFEKNSITKRLKIREILQEKGFSYRYLSASGGYIYKNKAYIAAEEKPYIIEIDFEKDNINALKLEGTDAGSMALIGKNERMYLLNNKKCIVEYNIEKAYVENIIDFSADGEFCLRKPFLIENTIYFFSQYDGKLVKYFAEKKRIIVSNLSVEWGIGVDDTEKYRYTGCIDEEKVIFISNYRNMVIVNLCSNEYRQYHLDCGTEEIKERLLRDVRFGGKTMTEETFSDLLGLLFKYQAADEKVAEDLVGKQIFAASN